MRSAGVSRLSHLYDELVFAGLELVPPPERSLPASGRRSQVRRVLVLSVSAGAGHVRAAQAIAAHAAADFPRLDVHHIDMMTLVPGWFRRLYSDLYMKLASGLPEAWGWLYRKTGSEPQGAAGTAHGDNLPDRLRRLVQRLCARRLFDELARYQPDVILCTHFLPAELLGSAVAQRKLDLPVWVQVTDFDLHPMWVHKGICGYFVANEELAWRLQAMGVPGWRAIVSGIPVMPGFLHRPDRGSAAARFGLDPAKLTVLMMGGGGGLGMDATLVRRLLVRHPALQIVVMAGRNASLLAELQTMTADFPDQLRALGYTDEVPALMACADLAITKPGGLSTSECLVAGLPMLLVNPIPGQEERNAAWLMQEGVALRADDPVTLQFRLSRLLQDRPAMLRMRSRAMAVASPRAAHDVLQQLSVRRAAYGDDR